MSKFYITTPLYYVNDEPHIGHAYTTILADVLARYHRSFGDEVYFLTGTDEHGQKVQQAAEKRAVEPKKHVDEFVQRFQSIWGKLNISHDDFIRTTEPRHTERVKEVLNSLFEKGEIYLAEYEGLYSVSEERFITEKEAEEGNFREIKKIKEKNYFFKMSNYQQQLIDHIQNNSKFILPKKRANEVLGFLKQPLNDLCISRPKSRLEWGIEIPFDADYVTYVWFDALLNYITGIGYGVDNDKFNKWWPASYHLIGKDILTTHSVYWITMLMAMKVELPKSIFAHGWWLTDDEKMSKSLGNVVRPLDLADQYGVDSLRYFLMRDMVLGQDASYSFDAFMLRYNSDLANDFGNLVNRVTILIRKNFDAKVPQPGEFKNEENEILQFTNDTAIKVKSAILKLKIHDAIELIMSVFRNLNKYLELRAPWKQIKESKEPHSPAATCLYVALNVLYKNALLLHPVMPEKVDLILEMLGQKCPQNIFKVELISSGIQLGEGKSPFPRIDSK
jgi:methionyl-tRNA synthetase